MSGPGNTPKGEPQRFAACLYPHRSLGRRGRRWAIGLVALAICAGSIVPIALGAWPVAGFLGLDLAALWLAFRMNERDGRRYEEVAVDPAAVVLRQHDPRGWVREHRFPTPAASFRVDRREPVGIVAMTLGVPGRLVGFGHFLNPPDRESFADAFGRALAAARVANRVASGEIRR
jgi:uncharacterized membrane protein